MENKDLLFKKEGNIGIITLNRPQAFNTITVEVWEALDECMDMIEKDDSIRAVILNGNGDTFTAGIDLSVLKQFNSTFVAAKLPWAQRLYSRFQEWSIPVIAAVHGLCYGTGIELILGCDIRIAAEGTRFSIPEVKFGLAPDMGGTTKLTKLVGSGQAKRLIMCCDEIDAAEARQIGLVEYVVPKEELMERAHKVANRMMGMPPAGISFAKKGINLAVDNSVAAGLLFEMAQSTYCCGTEDKTEAAAAFLEKRKPVFKGK